MEYGRLYVNDKNPLTLTGRNIASETVRLLKRGWEGQRKEKGGWCLGYADEAGGEPCNPSDNKDIEGTLV